MVNVAEKTLNEVDVVLWLVEPTNFIGAGEQHIIEQLKKVNTPVILIINKVDTVEKEKVLEYIDNLPQGIRLCRDYSYISLKRTEYG